MYIFQYIPCLLKVFWLNFVLLASVKGVPTGSEEGNALTTSPGPSSPTTNGVNQPFRDPILQKHFDIVSKGRKIVGIGQHPINSVPEKQKQFPDFTNRPREHKNSIATFYLRKDIDSSGEQSERSHTIIAPFKSVDPKKGHALLHKTVQDLHDQGYEYSKKLHLDSGKVSAPGPPFVMIHNHQGGVHADGHLISVLMRSKSPKRSS